MKTLSVYHWLINVTFSSAALGQLSCLEISVSVWWQKPEAVTTTLHQTGIKALSLVFFENQCRLFTLFLLINYLYGNTINSVKLYFQELLVYSGVQTLFQTIWIITLNIHIESIVLILWISLTMITNTDVKEHCLHRWLWSDAVSPVISD